MFNLEPPPFSAHLPPENAILEPSVKIKPDYGREKIMENFKGMIFKFASSSSPTKSLSTAQRSLVKQRLDEVFPSFHVPDHPPYTAMIKAAMRRLREQRASSSEEGISQFIRKEYPDLPWAHDTILKYHLGNLCENGGDRTGTALGVGELNPEEKNKMGSR